MSIIDIVSAEQYKEVTADNKVIVKVSTTTCAPCKMVAPIFEKIADESEDDSVVFCSLIPSEENDTEVLARELSVSSVPAFLIYENGEIVDRFVGAHPLNKLKTLLKL